MIDQLRKEEAYTVGEVCEALGLSRSGYYAARSASVSRREAANHQICKEIEAIHSGRHTHCYGSPRMTVELNARGISCSENRVARLMVEMGINARKKAAFRPKTTILDPTKQPSPNLLKTSEPPSGPGEIYVSDITYVATREGWLYLAVVLDLFSRKIAGWALADHMKTELVTSAWSRALRNVPPGEGALFHSDRGCQYTSRKMRTYLRLTGMVQSMSAKGYCYDNAKSESFFATLKREAFPDNCCFETKAEARLAIFEYLECFYNRRRRHSALGNISPDDFLKRNFQKHQTILQ